MVLAIFGCATTADDEPLPQVWREAGLSREDAEYLLNEALRLVVERKCVAGHPTSVGEPARVLVLDTAIGNLRLRPVGDVSFEPVSESTLDQRAQAMGRDINYYRFDKIKREGETVVLQLNTVPRYAAEAKTLPDAGGTTIEFTREQGSWKHSCGVGWVS
ncbi:MAG TPA: hypothetical protein VEK79_07655 [Thermoanaerobaculia bacterium]|nr:hypothetical protein [Thermoanaerobaculia bacterium]